MADFDPDNPNQYVMHGGVPLHVYHEQQTQAHQADLLAQGRYVSPGGYAPHAPARASTFFRNVMIWGVALLLFHSFESNRWIPEVAILTAVLLTIPAFRGCAFILLALVAVAFGFTWKYAPRMVWLPLTQPVAAYRSKPINHHKPQPMYHHHKSRLR